MDRFKKIKGYTFDKLIFRIYFILVFLLSVLVCREYGFDFHNNFYIKCNSYQGCQVDNIKERMELSGIKCSYDWCNDILLPYGFEQGQNPKIINDFYWILLLLTGLAIGMNHVLYTRRDK
jgi:hypothetical protein